MILSNKVALITGGASGIGAAIAERFVREGAKVVIGDLAVTDTGTSEIAARPLDVTDPESVGSTIDWITNEYGRLDCVVHSAGVAIEKPFLDTSIDDFDRMVRINLRGTFIIGQAAARAMIPNGGGAIVNIASVSGLIGNGGRSAYGTAKGGAVTLSKIMAVELAERGVRVNVIAPGPVETPLVARIHSAKTRQEWHDRVPLGRYGRPDEMTGAATFLCSDDASYITGQVMAVDGGFLIKGLSPPIAA